MLLRSRLCQTTIVLLMVVSQTLTTTGIPLPVPTAANSKDRSRPFPCMDRPCGCMNAEQCEKECCCFTRAEKEAWAAAYDASTRDKVSDEGNKDVAACPHCSGASCCDETAKDESSNSTWVIGLVALQCQSCGPLGLLAVTPAITVSDGPLTLTTPEVGEVLRSVFLVSPSLSLAPVEPPPRQS